MGLVALVWIGIAMAGIFFIAWLGRNIFKYMYNKQWDRFNKLLWWVLFPVGVIGIVLVIVGGVVGK